LILRNRKKKSPLIIVQKGLKQKNGTCRSTKNGPSGKGVKGGGRMSSRTGRIFQTNGLWRGDSEVNGAKLEVHRNFRPSIKFRKERGGEQCCVSRPSPGNWSYHREKEQRIREIPQKWERSQKKKEGERRFPKKRRRKREKDTSTVWLKKYQGKEGRTLREGNGGLSTLRAFKIQPASILWE